MKITEVGNRGILFTFDDETSVYLIHADSRLVLCDTHCGPESMEPVKEYIATHGLDKKELLIFNSHSDWDHIWGNCAFPGATIVGHEECRKRMQERGNWDLTKLNQKLGEVEIRLPNLTFSDRLCLVEDGIEFIYTPGHTVCSSICFDRKDSVLYVGDLVEEPIPYILYHDVERFGQSLELLKSFSANVIISAHSGIVEEKLIEDNLAYIQKVIANVPVELPEDFRVLDDFNRKNALILQYEKIVRERLGERFELPVFLREFWGGFHVAEEDLGRLFKQVVNRQYEELEEALKEYIAKI